MTMTILDSITNASSSESAVRNRGNLSQIHLGDTAVFGLKLSNTGHSPTILIRSAGGALLAHKPVAMSRNGSSRQVIWCQAR